MKAAAATFDSETVVADRKRMDSNADTETRVIVVTGAGGNYSSGGDLDGFQNLAQRTHPPIGQRMMEALNDATKPVIAAIEGLALGGSTTMLLHFDLVYAGRSARFRLPFVNPVPANSGWFAILTW